MIAQLHPLSSELFNAVLVDPSEEHLSAIFKHSINCSHSADRLDWFHQFIQKFPHFFHHVYILDVINQRALSNAIEIQTGVIHQTPQLLVFRQGKVIAHHSHQRLQTDWLQSLIKI